LPSDKQFLITRNVPCFKRATSFKTDPANELLVEGDEWVSTHPNYVLQEKVVEFEDIKGEPMKSTQQDHGQDIEDFDNPQAEHDDLDDAVIVENNDQHVLHARTYDLTITYDTYYRTPRFWLFGYDEVENV
jgi:ubiquitin-like-conjugating enzyme ATG3